MGLEIAWIFFDSLQKNVDTLILKYYPWFEYISVLLTLLLNEFMIIAIKVSFYYFELVFKSDQLTQLINQSLNEQAGVKHEKAS